MHVARFLTASLAAGLCLGATGASAEEAHEGYHPNLIAVFGGITREGRRDNEPALGIEYERRLSEGFGVGALVEHTFGEDDFTVYAISAVYHNGPWKLFAAPGIEDTDEGQETLLRVGIEYGFEIGDFEIAPQLDVDFVDGDEVFVYGISFGMPF